jgi:hypothetical protein
MPPPVRASSFRQLSAALLAASCLGAPTLARAQGNTARLEVTVEDADGNCQGALHLAQAVERRLGRHVFEPDAALVVRVTYERKGGGYLARIVLMDAQERKLGERELVSNSGRCMDIDSSVALVTALLVDTPLPEAASEQPSSSAEIEPPRPTRLLLAEEPPAIQPAEPWHFMVGADGLALFGRMPDLTYGARFDFDFKPPHVMWLKLEAAFYLPRVVQDTPSGASARVRFESVSVAACPWVAATSPAPSLCFGQELSFTQARGEKLDVNHASSRFGLTIFGRAGLAAHLAGPMWLRVGLTGGVPLVRDRYIFAGTDSQAHELFRTRPVIATGELGLAAALR